MTGASTGIGYELARCCAKHGFDLVIAADEAKVDDDADELRAMGVDVQTVQADVATLPGVDHLLSTLKERPVDALLANAGSGLAAPSSTRTSRQQSISWTPISRRRYTSFRRLHARCASAARDGS